MRPVTEYRARVLQAIVRTGAEKVPLANSVGRFLSTDVVAPHDVPSFANSAMDGFAVRAEDVAVPGASLRIIEGVAAGEVGSLEVGEGQATRIMTGAPMPDGADTVVRVEDTNEEDGRVEIVTAPAFGTSVRLPGGDVSAGTTVFSAGTRIQATHVGTLATIGVTSPEVAVRPRVAIMSTGDELAPADVEALAPGMIRDSNRPMLAALVSEAGGEVVDIGRIPDNAEAFRAAMGEAAATADVIVTSGGVSMGDFDVVKAVLRDEAEVDFFTVAMKPGKPQGFGVVGGRPFFGLPGNPVSVFVSFEQYVRPALLAMQGADRLLRPRVRGVAGESFVSDPEKEEFVRVRESEEGFVRSGVDGSHVLSGAANADALMVMGVGVDRVEPGDEVLLELFTAAETRSIGDE